MSSTLYAPTYKLAFMAGKLSERINLLISETDSKPAEIARAAKVSGSTVMYWRNGQTQEIKSKNARALAQHYGYSADWLMTGDGAPRPVPQLKAPVGVRDVAVVPYTQQKLTAAERLQQMIKGGGFSDQDLEAIANFIAHFKPSEAKK